MVSLFWVEMFSPARTWFGLDSTLVPYCSSMLSPGMLVPCFPISMENRDLGDGFGTVFGGF
jgi:hypothetical protein